MWTTAKIQLNETLSILFPEYFGEGIVSIAWQYFQKHWKKQIVNNNLSRANNFNGKPA